MTTARLIVVLLVSNGAALLTAVPGSTREYSPASSAYAHAQTAYYSGDYAKAYSDALKAADALSILSKDRRPN